MPEKQTLERARADKKAGKAPSTQAGEFIREQIDHIREGKHGARSTKQAIAIGLSEARRAGVDLPPPRAGKTSDETRKRAARDYARGMGRLRAARTPAARRQNRGIARAAARSGRPRWRRFRRSVSNDTARFQHDLGDLVLLLFEHFVASRRLLETQPMGNQEGRVQFAFHYQF